VHQGTQQAGQPREIRGHRDQAADIWVPCRPKGDAFQGAGDVGLVGLLRRFPRGYRKANCTGRKPTGPGGRGVTHPSRGSAPWPQ